MRSSGSLRVDLAQSYPWLREPHRLLRRFCCDQCNMWSVCVLLFLLVGSDQIDVSVGHCNREPEGRVSPKSPADNRFRINISGNPEKYVPGEVYTVTLQGSRTHDLVYKFTGFLLVAEPKDSVAASVGTFQLFGDALTKFSERCLNAVTQTSSLAKTEVQVLWTAPPTGSGCIMFRATVVEHRDVWYMDDGLLSRQLCEDIRENQDEQPEVIDPCCACDEAKYEVTFEGLWSRHTHPKDFPSGRWMKETRFSDIIGASHTVGYRFWEYGGVASEGLRQMADNGTTRMLESELKAESEHIRTIIKARGISYPNVTGKTFAVFRVDRRHHLMSIVSMLYPSPDWIVGVSALELCRRNCSWVEYKVLNMYPWDAGTDSGATYTSSKAPTTPREKISRITSSFPNDTRSPFYSAAGGEMKPLARLYLTRQRLYEKSCADDSLVDLEDDYTGDIKRQYAECAVTEWLPWSACSVSCGKGVRMRQRLYVDPSRADFRHCDRNLVSKETCVGRHPNCDSYLYRGFLDERRDDPVCAVTTWGSWSSCSTTCGPGTQIRTRRYKHKLGHKKCRWQLVERKICFGSQGNCEEDPEEVDPRCAVTEWSDWSPCTTTCGRGRKVRTRLYTVPESWRSDCDVTTVQEMECDAEIATCELDLADAKDVCMLEKDVGLCVNNRNNMVRWYFDSQKGICTKFFYSGCRGNRNNFKEEQDCTRICGNLREEVLANRTARLQQYGVSVSGVLTYVLQDSGGSLHAENVDPSCDNHTKEFFRLHKAANSYLDTSTPFSLTSVITSDDPSTDCQVSQWSDWTACSTTCGRGKKERTRNILVHPRNGGKVCPRLTKRRRCKSRKCGE